MPNEVTSSTHDSEVMHQIPFIEHEYILWKASRQKNRIVRFLAVTNIALLVTLAYILIKI